MPWRSRCTRSSRIGSSTHGFGEPPGSTASRSTGNTCSAIGTWSSCIHEAGALTLGNPRSGAETAMPQDLRQQSLLRSVNPATGETLGEYEETNPREVDAALSRAHRAFADWRGEGFPRRASAMRRAGSILAERKERYATLMAREMGKPLAQGRTEIEKCAWACDYFAENAERFLATERVSTDAKESFVTYSPLGVVLAVMPWNFPFWQVFRFAAPTLMAGNAAVLKHASNVSGCALAIGEIFREAGFPSGLFEVLLIRSEEV